MCGIAGFTGPKYEKLLQQLSTDLAHRGPDGEGVFTCDTLTLLNRRLAIIDRSGGDQPIYSEDKSLAVVYNGEIYNYKDLRHELETAGHTFKTHSDTEVIVHGFEEWGEDCFDKLNGMFAIALYDSRDDSLRLVRDQFGIKPIYYAQSAHNLIFSSEIKPILHSGWVEKKVNERILYRYLKFRVHDDEPDTFFDSIKRIQPGEMLTFRKGEISIRHYSSLDFKLLDKESDHEFSEADVAHFKELLTDSVRLRLQSEVPVGTCLSGGLDSSTIVAIVNQELQKQTTEATSVGSAQNTFSAVFPGSANDEEHYMKLVLDSMEQVKSHKIHPKPEEFFEDIEDFIRTQEEPTISTGPYAQYKVMQEASKHVTVLLDGQGADEMMAGYLPHYFVYLRQLQAEGNYKKLFAEIWASKDILTKFAWYVFQREVFIKRDVSVEDVLGRDFQKTFSKESLDIVRDNLKARLHQDIFKNSLPSLLRYEDRNSMRFSIEGRVPFLDDRLLKYLFSRSDEAIIGDGWNKHILRKAVNGLVPEQIASRRNKIGFTTPEDEWFLRMKNRIYGIFMSESFTNRPYFNQPSVVKAFREFIEGKNDDTLLFWRLLNVELWLREFIDPPSPQVSAGNVKTEWVFGQANEGKKIEIEVNRKIYHRYPIRTELFQKCDDYAGKIAKYISNLVGATGWSFVHNGTWYVIVSEKIVAISQGRSFFIWDIKASWWAKTLSKFVTKTPYGIGLGSPWTMQIAIEEAGLARILFATVAAAIGKVFGLKGLFYRLAGNEVNAIDGPTEYSVYPSNVSAKLAPKDPYDAAEKIRKVVQTTLSSLRRQGPPKRDSSGTIRHLTGNESVLNNFGGVVIIDANDLGRNVLGNATDKPNSFFEDTMRDNPMGQGSEQTPIVILSSQ